MTAILKVDTIQDTAGNNIINENANTVTIGKAGDTVNVVGTLQNNSSALVTGKVLQVVSTQNITDFSTSSGTFVDVTGATLNITPSSTSSKILLLCNTNTYQNTIQAYFALRWKRDIGGSVTTFGNGTYGQTYARSAVANDFWGGVGMTYLDSPNTTSAITYTVQASTAGSGTMGFGINSANASNIFAIEIGA